jgi:hypothetical protein
MQSHFFASRGSYNHVQKLSINDDPTFWLGWTRCDPVGLLATLGGSLHLTLFCSSSFLAPRSALMRAESGNAQPARGNEEIALLK